ncbi:hypothetical protein DOK_05470 [gamma proteobacterium BDW918]|uniref:Uncharacterized protein n=1 Tax=Zhongshania aliphaticivorans TaxID=1470434 RepID=A0A127M217_9GAMM|nr:hypothetical protein [Zhongshania aliphaticivorans]AMO67275.1 hypothetical protein AZF00_02710 [Zhongshania aliphaticivorans]EIF44057.1 hypothetical protein DOK_05470 [gamma proteobacterium BDW918]
MTSTTRPLWVSHHQYKKILKPFCRKLAFESKNLKQHELLDFVAKALTFDNAAHLMHSLRDAPLPCLMHFLLIHFPLLEESWGLNDDCLAVFEKYYILDEALSPYLLKRIIPDGEVTALKLPNSNQQLSFIDLSSFLSPDKYESTIDFTAFGSCFAKNEDEAIFRGQTILSDDSPLPATYILDLISDKRLRFGEIDDRAPDELTVLNTDGLAQQLKFAGTIFNEKINHLINSDNTNALRIAFDNIGSKIHHETHLQILVNASINDKTYDLRRSRLQIRRGNTKP